MRFRFFVMNYFSDFLSTDRSAPLLLLKRWETAFTTKPPYGQFCCERSRATYSLQHFLASNKSYQEHDDRDHEENVDESTDCIGCKNTKEPKDYKDNGNCS